MVNMNDAFPSKYLSAADLNGAEPTVTISHCQMEDLGGGDQKPVVYFEGRNKGLALNKTNAMTLSGLYGPESDGWTGHQITIFSIWTEYQGKQTQGLRVRTPDSPAAARQPMHDDAPHPADTEQASNF